MAVIETFLSLAGVLLTSIGLHSGAAGAWALLAGKNGDEIGRQAAFGASVGFLVGLPLTLAMGILYLLT